MISLDECSASCNAADKLYRKILVPSKTEEDVNAQVFNMITRINESKTQLKYISCDCKCKRNRTSCTSNQKLNSETFHCECKSKNYCTCTKDCICNPSTCIHENGKYVKSIADTLLSICNEIIDAMGNV